jgi:glyoxylate/hydroxypyruvate reductase A
MRGTTGGRVTKGVVVIKCGDQLVPSWVENMTALLPEFEVVPYYAPPDRERVRYVIGWRPDARWINEFTNVKAVVSIGSGVDHIEHLDELRAEIPVIRTVSPDLVQRMKEFAALCVLAWHRQLPQMLENSKKAKWHRYAVDTADAINVGIMGFGGMGQAAAATLKDVGYHVSVWASSPRDGTGYEYFYGSEQLQAFAAGVDVLICMLPLTSRTADILNYDLFSILRKGACIVNLGRGGHLVDDDLVLALREGQLSAAFLDPFRQEPLPEESSLWRTPNVFVTCHSAAYISPEAGPKIIAENIRKFDAGEPVAPLYDRKLGY